MDAPRKALVLCGGQGLRLRGAFSQPKPLVMVRGRPLVEHVIRTFSSSSVDSVVLLVGSDEALYAEFAEAVSVPGLAVSVLQTGAEAATGERVRRAFDVYAEEQRFFVTYADGISDISLRELFAAHLAGSRYATLTAVRPRLPYGLLDIDDDDEVRGFDEKPVMQDHVNGGFMVLERDVRNYIGINADLECEVLPALAAQHQLTAYRHYGFWHGMDTYKDYMYLNALDASEWPH